MPGPLVPVGQDHRVTPEAEVIMHHCIALLRTLPGVTEESVQAITAYLGIIIEYAESR